MGSSNVVKMYPPNAAHSADNVLEQAVGVYDDVLLLGWDKDGALDARATSTLTGGQIVWLLNLFQNKLLSGDYGE